MQNDYSFIFLNKEKNFPKFYQGKSGIVLHFCRLSLMSSLKEDVGFSCLLYIHCSIICCLVEVYEEILALYTHVIEKKKNILIAFPNSYGFVMWPALCT